MNIYLVTQDINRDYDTYDSFVVVASDEIVARHTHPSPFAYDHWFVDEESVHIADWASPIDVNVKLIGTTDKYNETTIICSSFNAG